MIGNTSGSSNRVYLNRRTTLQFIQLFKEHECLYNPSHDDYLNRDKKNLSLEFILHELQKFIPELSIENIKSKIKTIRTQLAHEMTMLEAKEVAGIPYKPRLWCFKHLDFLRKFMSRGPVEKNMSFDDSDSNDEGKSFYRELTEGKPYSRPTRRRLTDFKWTRDIVQLFIKLYKNKKCLYDVQHVDYKDRERKVEARQQILDEMKERAPRITMKDIWLKHKCLRDQYMKEFKAVEKAKARKKPYRPKLWCFQQLSYLNPYLDNVEMDDNCEDEAFNSSSKVEINSVALVNPSNGDEVTKQQDKDAAYTELYGRGTSHTSDFGSIVNSDIEDEEDNSNDNSSISENLDLYRSEVDSNHEDLNDLERNLLLSDHNNDIADDEIEYEESVLKTQSYSYVELPPYKRETDQNVCLDFKQQKSCGEHVKFETVDTKSADECQSRKELPRNDFKWLGSLVTSQMKDISPSYRSEFAWDIQCLVRKYILKSKDERDKKKTISGRDLNDTLLLPRPTSLNISFL